MNTISIEFCLVTLLLLLIFTVNILHILYLIIYKHNHQIKSLRSILINSSLASLIVSIWLIPFFYFRTLWSPESFPWRLWSFVFHLVDAVQTYSLLLILTTRSFQRTFICFTWLAPIFAYSPILWLSSPLDSMDYLPYRRFTIDNPWWILTILYLTMYLLPIILSFLILLLQIYWPNLFVYYQKSKKMLLEKSTDEHHQDMAELTTLVKTVMNFQLETSSSKSNTLSTWTSSNDRSKEINRSLASQICQHESFFLFDELSISPLIQRSNPFDQPIHSCLLLLIICLLLLVHVPYVLLAIFDLSTFQLSIFIYIHWFGTLFLPMIHIQ